MDKILKSSANPEKISLTIKGIGVAVIPAVVFILSGLGFSVAQADLTQVINAVATIASAIMVLVGLGRKIYIRFNK